VLLLILAAAFGVARLLAWVIEARAAGVTLDSLWAGIDATSLAGLKDFVARSVSPALGSPILNVLLLPVWLVFGLVGGLLVALCRRRSRFY
jgi:hypothetical protein